VAVEADYFAMSAEQRQRESPLRALMRKQRAWATLEARAVDSKGYLNSVEANLWRSLSEYSRTAFEKGSGSELKQKMRALHSSSALAVNFFDYWTTAEPTTLMHLLGLDSPVSAIRFEAQHHTGLQGTPPNLDVCVVLESGHTVAIESKFTEWLKRKRFRDDPFKAKYFPPAQELWTSRGLPACQFLASDMQSRRQRFQHFDAPQMLKHALGLATQLGSKFSLWYVYFDCECPESDIHKAEIRQFADRVGAEIRFKVLTYQELFRRLESAGSSIDRGYVTYLERRYFAASQIG
jgi:hypothetical protein